MNMWILNRSKRRQQRGFLILSFLCYLLLNACAVRQQTVVPKAIVSTEASFDGESQNSGIVKFDEHGFIVTAHWMERYDGMLSKFGGRFTPAVMPGDRIGVEVFQPSNLSQLPTFRISQQVMVRFTRMNGWRKAEAGP